MVWYIVEHRVLYWLLLCVWIWFDILLNSVFYTGYCCVCVDMVRYTVEHRVLYWLLCVWIWFHILLNSVLCTGYFCVCGYGLIYCWTACFVLVIVVCVWIWFDILLNSVLCTSYCVCVWIWFDILLNIVFCTGYCCVCVDIVRYTVEQRVLYWLLLCVWIWFDILLNSVLLCTNRMWNVVPLQSVGENFVVNFPGSQFQAQ
jgi:hypothetical protein